MATFVCEARIAFDTDSKQFTASLEYCEPAPGIVIEETVEGTGSTLREALEDLAFMVDGLSA